MVTAYDESTLTATVPWTATTAGAQAYAHVIDGYLPQVTSQNQVSQQLTHTSNTNVLF